MLLFRYGTRGHCGAFCPRFTRRRHVILYHHSVSVSDCTSFFAVDIEFHLHMSSILSALVVVDSLLFHLHVVIFFSPLPFISNPTRRIFSGQYRVIAIRHTSTASYSLCVPNSNSKAAFCTLTSAAGFCVLLCIVM